MTAFSKADLSAEFFIDNWLYIAGFVVMFAVVGVTLRLLSDARRHSEAMLDKLLYDDVDLYLKVLTTNKRLRWVFRKSLVLLMLLKGYIAKGDDEKARQCIDSLDGMKLEPGEKLEFLEIRLSFFALRNCREQALQSRDKLVCFLKSIKADKIDRYVEIMEEADAIVKVYIEQDVGFIDNLIHKASVTAHPVVRGVTQYRIARLAYLKGDEHLTDRYLSRALKNLKGTSYQNLVECALLDRNVLASQ